MDYLIFIDTNILLDFYRYAQGSALLPTLKHIDKHHSIVITNSQIEMEFKKNRQKIILDAIAHIKGPSWDKHRIPVIMTQAQPSKIISRNKKEIERQTKKLQKRIEAVLKDPATNDLVYQTAQRLFRNKSNLNLRIDNPKRTSVERLAKRRFIAGYPPRKPGDTSIGDAINWEWVVHCAKNLYKNIIIVSRDSDFGCTYGKETIVNDWLQQEFKERVGRKKIILTERLTTAFEIAQVQVKKQEIQAENELISTISILKKQLDETMRESTKLRLSLLQDISSSQAANMAELIRKFNLIDLKERIDSD